jgi:HSP20 family protein
MLPTNFDPDQPLRTDPFQPDEHSFFDLRPGWRVSLRPATWRPPTDVYEIEDGYVVRVEIAGMREEDFSVELDGRSLVVRGVRSDYPERRAFHQMEIRYGEFSIEIEMPAPVLAADVQATYQEGFLRIQLPKARAKQIHIEE